MIYGEVKLIMSVCVALFVLGQSTPLPEVEPSPVRRISAVDGEHRMGIIVSPKMTMTMNREIAIYWTIESLRKGRDTLTLYDGHPEVNGSKPLYSFQPRKISGVRKTRISADFVPTSELSYQESCLKYYVVWHRYNILQRIRCLATYPNWMNQRRGILGTKQLNEMFIPGTHDSGAYAKERDAKVESVINKYIITQDEDVLSQLIYGIRYLDIRVGRHPGTGPIYWANHGYFSVHPLSDVIDDVKTFLRNTQEIVIFDVHEFPVGFSASPELAHVELIAHLEKEFDGYYLERNKKNWEMSLNEIWATGHRLILCYNHYFSNFIGHMWPAVTHRWPNVKTMDKLYAKIESFENGSDPVKNFARKNRPPASVMAQFTSEPIDVIFDLLGGVRAMAEVVNMNVTMLYHEKWRCVANIVSMDYFKGSGIIEAAIEWNDRRLLACRGDLNKNV